MPTQATSAEAYRDLEARGVLRGQRAEVYAAFERFGPGTAAEVLKRAALHGNLNLARARVSELANAGYLRECKPRKCKVTGRRAIVWRALDDDELPCPREREHRITLTDEDVQAIADFVSGKRGQFCPNLANVHTKILDAAKERTP